VTAGRKVVPTALGRVVIEWQDGPRVVRILLPGEAGTGRASGPGHPAVDRLAQDIQRALAGRPVAFGSDLLALDWCPAFQQAVLRATAVIPRGRVSTYGRLAEKLGRPGAARAVGNALARNPFPVVIPCHRVVRSDGGIGGFGGGVAMKRALLVMEGVEVGADGRVRPESAC